MALLRKDDLQNLQAPPAGATEHPLFNGSTTVGMISGESPRFPIPPTIALPGDPAPVRSGHDALGATLKQMGLKAESRDGRYGAPEKSYMVYGPTREQMYHLGKQYGQESVVFSEGGKPELLYTNGPNAGRYHPALNHEWFNSEPEDYYTHMPELGGYLRLNFDWDTLHPSNLGQNAAIDALHSRAGVGGPGTTADGDVSKAEIAQGLLATLKKALSAATPQVRPHPHAYPWHNEHTDHHLHVASPGVVLVSRGAPMAKADPQAQPAHVNDQAAGAGVSTYAKYALPFGSIDKTNPADLFHYPYQGKAQAVNQLLKDHGYSVYYAGGKYGRPDLANRNYNTKHLMIYDPSPGSGGDFGTEEYTDNWRKVHELAHALTYPDLNKVYGEGRRIGKLGHHRTLREGLRSVHWEHLAAHKQRELNKQLGIHVPDHVFNKEYNTVMHDAIHRAVTGKFTEPSQEGFRPHEYHVPLETSLGMVREGAHNLGLTGMHDLIKKSEDNTMADEKTYEPREWRKLLAKALQDRVDAYAQQLLELRKRELAKAEQPEGVVKIELLAKNDKCPLCDMPDLPGKCKCLNGPLAKSIPKNDEAKKNELASEAADEDPGMAKNEMCKSCGKMHEAGKDYDHDFGKKELSTKPKEPVKADNEGGNGIKVRKLKLTKGDFGASDNGKVSTLPTPAAPKIPGKKFGMADLAAGKQKLAAAGVKPISPLGAPKPAAPAAPAPGVGGLKPPPAPAPALPKPAAPAPAAAGPKLPSVAPKIPKVAAAPKPAAAAPAMKSEGVVNDLKKNLGSCPLCKKNEHAGECK
jgi:hypothetical protein